MSERDMRESERLTLQQMRAYRRPLLPQGHSEIIAGLLGERHRARAKDFHRTLWGALCDGDEAKYLPENELDYAWLKKVMPLKPDAYRIDPLRRHLIIYEVEVSSRLTPRKLQVLGSFSVHLAVLDWGFTLIRIDEYGRHRKEEMEPFIAAGWLQANGRR